MTKTTSRNVLRVVALVVIIGLIAGFAALVLWKPAANVRTGRADVDSSGRKTYCSDYGYLCLKYPPNWKLATFETSDEAISPETTTITSPSTNVVVTYRPNFGIGNRTEEDILSVSGVDPTESPDLHVISMITQYDGSYEAQRPYTPEIFVTNNLQATNGMTFTAGATIASKFESVFHEYTPQNNSKITSYLYVKFDQKGPYSQVAAGSYASYREAFQTISDPEARTALQILRSAQYKK